MEDQNHHRECAKGVYSQYEYAREQQKQHEEHRSYVSPLKLYSDM